MYQVRRNNHDLFMDRENITNYEKLRKSPFYQGNAGYDNVWLAIISHFTDRVLLIKCKLDLWRLQHFRKANHYWALLKQEVIADCTVLESATQPDGKSKILIVKSHEQLISHLLSALKAISVLLPSCSKISLNLLCIHVRYSDSIIITCNSN